jgi:hypothetical protein
MVLALLRTFRSTTWDRTEHRPNARSRRHRPPTHASPNRVHVISVRSCEWPGCCQVSTGALCYYHDKCAADLLSPVDTYLTPTEIKAMLNGRSHGDGRRLDHYVLDLDPIDPSKLVMSGTCRQPSFGIPSGRSMTPAPSYSSCSPSLSILKVFIASPSGP